MHLLMGNHELMAVQTLFAKDEREWNNKMDLWLKNGGGVTFYHFLELSEEEQEEIAVYLSLLPGEMEIKVKDKVFHLVHGFAADTLEKQVWTRPTLETENLFQDKRLIVGHTPVMLLHANEDIYKAGIEVLDLSARASNCLDQAGYTTVGKLVENINKRDDLKKLRNCGEKTMDEIMDTMRSNSEKADALHESYQQKMIILKIRKTTKALEESVIKSEML